MENTMPYTNNTKTILFSILLLFFLQSLSDFIEAIYAFGLLVTTFTIEVASIILLFTPFLLIFFHKPPSRLFLIGLTFLAMLARLIEPMLDPRGKLVACGIGVGAFMLLFPVLLYNHLNVRDRQLGNSLAITLSLSIFLRTANSSLDLAESGMFQVISWLLAMIAGSLIWRMELSSPEEIPTGKMASCALVTGLAIGLASIILIIYFAFASPTVIARWTGFSYPAIVILLVSVIVIFSFLIESERFLGWLTQRNILVWNALFILMVVLTILPHQISFPANPESYPIDAPSVSPLAGIFLFLMLVLSPILFIDFILFARKIPLERPSLQQIGRSFTVAALFFLIMVFFHVFTTIYDYAPIIGPLFRDRFWLVYLLAGLGLGLPVLLVNNELFLLKQTESTGRFTPIAVGVLALLSMIALYLTTSKPVAQQIPSELKIMTYNIQQGFDVQGNKNLNGQLAVIQKVNPDILGLQESDTARVANGNVDGVRYFADNLDMYSYYGPTTTTGTFGIALLSKYPIEKATTFFMYSEGEQTATIHAEIMIGGKPYQIFVTHLGNGGPIFQLEDMLIRVEGLQNVIAMGDFNFEPTTDQYALATGSLADSWLSRWPGGKETPGFSKDNRIDHIFVSPGIKVVESEYDVNPASDHPYLYSVIQP